MFWGHCSEKPYAVVSTLNGTAKNKESAKSVCTSGVELLAQECKQGLGWITLTRRQEQKVGKMLFVKFSLYQV